MKHQRSHILLSWNTFGKTDSADIFESPWDSGKEEKNWFNYKNVQI